jgi:hypothetical protein
MAFICPYRNVTFLALLCQPLDFQIAFEGRSWPAFLNFMKSTNTRGDPPLSDRISKETDVGSACNARSSKGDLEMSCAHCVT